MLFGKKKHNYLQAVAERLEQIDEHISELEKEIREEARSNTEARSSLHDELKKTSRRELMELSGLSGQTEESFCSLREELLSERKGRQREASLNRILGDYIEAFDRLYSLVENDENHAETAELIRKQLAADERDCDIERINETGALLDYELHEVLSVEASGDAGNNKRIARVHRSGYKLNGKVVRKALVTVYISVDSEAG